MKKIHLICYILCGLLLIQPMLLSARAADTDATAATDQMQTEPTVPTEETLPPVSDISVTDGCSTIEAQVPVYSDTLLTAAGSAMLFETNTQTLIYARNPDEPMDPAALVKIMTALIAVEQGDIDRTVSVTTTALSSLPKSAHTSSLQVGEQITLGNLLHLLLCGSSNDAAAVIAEHISGSQGIFVAEMNKRARELGCTNTNFMNAHGLHDANQYTTARDMCRILMEVMDNETFMTFFGTKEYTVPATNMSEPRELITTNYLMVGAYTYYGKYVTGGRTGVTNTNRRCLAVTAENETMRYVSVVLGAEVTVNENTGIISSYGNYEDAKRLYNLGFEKMRSMQIMSESQILEQYPVANGSNHIVVGPGSTVRAILPVDTDVNTLTIKYLDNIHDLSAPIAVGEKLTTVQFWYGDCCVAEADLLARNPSPVAQNMVVDTWTPEYKGPDLLMMAVVVLVLAAVFALTAGVLYVIRRVQIAMMRAQSRRRRRDRRRSK